jgi:cell division protein FtsQ
VWDNPRVLNLAAGVLVGIVALMLLAASIFLVWRSALFPVRQIEVTTALKQTSREDIERAAQARIEGNFFAVSPDAVRLGLEKLPWVRRASVRRVWPDRLEVELEEHVALARWGDEGLVNTYGERFQGASDPALPLFVGPAASEHEMALRYARFAALLAPLAAPLERVVLTQRYAWQLRLAGGLDIMLGRDGDLAEQRLQRFITVYDATLKTIPRRHQYVDLRYPNGFALRMPELKGS